MGGWRNQSKKAKEIEGGEEKKERLSTKYNTEKQETQYKEDKEKKEKGGEEYQLTYYCFFFF